MPEANSITEADVRKVATLARLSLDETHVALFAGQLEAILGYVKKIEQVDVTGIEPLAHALPIHNILREDVPGPALPLEKVLQNAPDTDGAFFKVPKVIAGGEDSAG